MLRARIERADGRALAVLAGTPIVLMAVAALAGYPLLTGDDVIQNYPLRALVGEILRHGHLPVLNPYAWAGTPLLGGINAGAALPANWLFVVLPPLAAWVLTEGLAYAAAAVGLYAFLRGNRLSPLPASLGAATYGLAGFLASQAVHLDVVQTGAALAWMLVALERIADGRDILRPAHCALLAASIGCVGLAGSPEAAFDAVVAAVLYSLHLLLHDRRRVRTGGFFLLGAALGVLVAAVQIVPGDRFVAISQRSAGSLAFLGAGGISPPHLLFLLAPHILGGGPIGLTPYVGRYDLGELDGYSGIASLVAIGALAARWRSPGASRWRVWYLIGLVGLVTALGGVTPLPHLLRHLPVVGLSRLPSRALLLFGLASAVLLAYWAAEVLQPGSVTPERAPARSGQRATAPAAGTSRSGAPGRPAGGGRAEALAGTVLPAMVLALVVALAIGGVPVAQAIGGQPTGPWSVARVMPYLAPTAALALAAAWFAVRHRHLGPRARTGALLAIALVDLLLFSANQSSFAPLRASSLDSPNASSRALARIVGPAGRFLVVDPGRLGGAVLDQVGAPNLNVFTGVASAQGYGSLTWGLYAEATGTHGQDVADPAAIAGTTFDALDVRALLALPGSFQAPVPSGPLTLAAARDHLPLLRPTRPRRRRRARLGERLGRTGGRARRPCTRGAAARRRHGPTDRRRAAGRARPGRRRHAALRRLAGSRWAGTAGGGRPPGERPGRRAGGGRRDLLADRPAGRRGERAPLAARRHDRSVRGAPRHPRRRPVSRSSPSGPDPPLAPPPGSSPAPPTRRPSRSRYVRTVPRCSSAARPRYPAGGRSSPPGAAPAPCPSAGSVSSRRWTCPRATPR